MIDKSARQYYAHGQLVKPTRHGLRPGYRGEGEYQGGHGYGGSKSDSGSSNGKDERASTPPRGPAELGITTRDTTPTSRGKDEDRPTSFKPAHWEELTKTTPKATPREKARVEQYKGITHDLGDGTAMEEFYNKPEEFTEEELEKGITEEGKTIGFIGDTPVTDKAAKEFGLGLKERNVITGEIQQGRNIINPFTNEIQSKFAPIDTPQSGFFNSGLGKVIKNVGLGIVAPQLLAGTKLGSLYSGYTTANRASTLADVLGWSKPKDVMSTFTSNLSKPKGTTDTTPKGDRNNREQGIMQAQVPKDVVSKSVEKFSPKQLDLLQQRYAELNKVIESGEYMGQKLNNNQLATLTQTSKQMKDFLVSEVGGMRLT